MNIFSKIGYYLILWSCKLIGLLPQWFLYGVLSPVIFFILYHIVGYRRKVVYGNLSRSFPEKDEDEIREIERKFYRHLANVMVDTIDISSITASQLRKKITFVCPPEIARIEEQGQDWIAALAHYGSWELFGAYQLMGNSQVVGVYKPLHSKVFDDFYNNIRSRFNLQPVAMHDILRFIIAHRNDAASYSYGLIADQTPPRSEVPHWNDFLNQKTTFYMGVEKLAIKFRLPVYYMHIEIDRKRHYLAKFVNIYDGEEQLAPGEITKRYVKMLENNIRETPHLWMWSHRRWKHKAPDEEC